MSALPLLTGQGGVVVLPVGDPALLAHIPDAQAQICHGCLSDSSGCGAEYILWISPRASRPYWPLCAPCLDRLAAFFRWWTP
jgi:hypothetical protein